jgi:hypothetical protein
MWVALQLLELHAVVDSAHDQRLPQVDALPEDAHLLVDLHCQLETGCNNDCEDAGWVFAQLVEEGKSEGGSLPRACF